MRLFFLALLLLLATYFSSVQEKLNAADSILIAEESGELDVDANTSPTYYELVDKRFKPDG